MGLAASQARFLGLTLRKANCEFKSTELAQQRLELTNQMMDISQEYANALNSTKLVWCNDAVTDSFGNPMDYGLSYSLMMMPSAANDYNPYMFSTRSGAIVLNSKYAQAARDAGISMAGGTPSQMGRDKFIESLSNSTKIGGVDQHDNVITQKTYEMLTSSTSGLDVGWHYSAGMGAIPKEKGVAQILSLQDLVLDQSIGGQTLDWLQIYKAALGTTGAKTEYEAKNELAAYNAAIKAAETQYKNYVVVDPDTGARTYPYSSDYVRHIKDTAYGKADGDMTAATNFHKIYYKFGDLEKKIANATNESARTAYQKELEDLKQGYETVNGVRRPFALVDENGNKSSSEESLLMCPLYWAIYNKDKAYSGSQYSTITWNSDENAYDETSVGISRLFYTNGDGIGGSGSHGIDGTPLENFKYNILTLCINDSITHSKDTIKNLTVGDLLTENVVIITQNTNDDDDSYDGVVYNNAQGTIELAATAMLKSIASVFGYGNIGTGLNTDTETNAAMEQAMTMTLKKFIPKGNAVYIQGGNDDALLGNGAYNAANNYNRMGVTNDNEGYAAINLSNMLSAFLTYYDNYLRGSDSQYVVGKGNTDGKTVFVTDDPSYSYVKNPSNAVTNDEKIADYFNQLYNNICAHGWRYDDMVQDSNYLESAVKDGRYQIMALNNDGYFYQMRYNEIGYMKEVQDEDAISRAESDFQNKKAMITFKEDQIDVKNKKLDAEITELNTEINSVQNIISKSIEKTFSMFSN